MAVLEVARLSIRPGAEEAFEAAFTEAQPYVQGAPGHLSSVLTRSVGRTSEYVFLVRWHSLADHVDRFASSPEFERFGGLIGPHFASDPEVEHFEELEVHT